MSDTPHTPDTHTLLATIAAAETALVAAASRWDTAAVAPAWAYAVVASKFLAASSPHSLGLFASATGNPNADGAMLAQAAAGLAVVFRPRDIRVVATATEAAAAIAGAVPGATVRGLRYRDVMAADVVIHYGAQAEAVEPRAGSHVVWIGPTPPPFSAALSRSDAIFAATSLDGAKACATLAAPWVRLSDIVAGRIDGRQLDEITVTWICTIVG